MTPAAAEMAAAATAKERKKDKKGINPP